MIPGRKSAQQCLPCLAFLLLAACGSKPPGETAPVLSNVTFSKDIAPIIYEQCAPCHRPGQAAPFALLTYSDAREHSDEIARVTARREMPPWPPQHGSREFVGERRLSDEQLRRIQAWVKQGAPEGHPADLPPQPAWNSDWHLGPPDLVIQMPEVYSLAPTGDDVYRNFVLPVPLKQPRYVRAVEFHPGNARIVHHTLIKLDRSGEARRLDQADPQCGFAGLMIPSETGHFIGWQPGRIPQPLPDGLSWQIRPGDDLVLQMHLHPVGTSESVQSSVGLYFTDQAPTNTPFRILLTSMKIDVPPGSTHSVEDHYTTPVDLQVLALLPHAHMTGKEIRGWATLPNGQTEPLIHIPNWDFNWQTDYRLKRPLTLPKGTLLSMRFTYANPGTNSTSIRYGPQSSDEMAEFWIQVLASNRNDLAVLGKDYQGKARARFFEGSLFRAQNNPADAEANSNIGMLYLTQQKFSEADHYLRRSLQADSKHAPGYYGLGLAHRMQNRPREAQEALQRAVDLNPLYVQARSNLGMVLIQNGAFDLAEIQFEEALRLNPKDSLAVQGLADLASRRQANR